MVTGAVVVAWSKVDPEGYLQSFLDDLFGVAFGHGLDELGQVLALRVHNALLRVIGGNDAPRYSPWRWFSPPLWGNRREGVS
ncbi:hypothetical protein GCM10022402_30500 [Salinactinospora qingdaonensis]|uniref:Uncharacterized protein n=1 Tax=Salinactinospora qingdaonensis TaxID=702744 RepID=A0ABP7FY97_9ACTN